MHVSSLAAGRSRNGLLREWIIFALSLGLGGHIALAIVLHDPQAWPWTQAGLRGLLIGISVYVVVQVLRSVWWLSRGRGKRPDDTSEEYS